MNLIQKLSPKWIIFGVCALCLNTLLSAQSLYIQPVGGGPQVSFTLADKPKVTFNERTMLVATPASNEDFQLDQVQNLSFTQKVTTGIETNDVSKNISIYPNPVKEEFTLSFETFTKGTTYRILDITGKLLKADNINSAVTKIKMQNYPKGVYVININQTGQQIQSFKIVKQ